jgi:hypothetical protein
MIMKKIVVFLVLIGFSCILKAQDHSFQLNIEGIQYDSLQLVGETIDKQVVKIKGESTDHQQWYFTISDSIYDLVSGFIIYPKVIKKGTDIVQMIYMETCLEGDTIRYGTMPVDRKVTKIDAKYIGTKINEQHLFVRRGNSETEDSLYYADFHSDRLLIPYYENTDYAVQRKYPHIGAFNNHENVKMSYTEMGYRGIGAYYSRYN